MHPAIEILKSWVIPQFKIAICTWNFMAMGEKLLAFALALVRNA
jgi:hypothetical protein